MDHTNNKRTGDDQSAGTNKKRRQDQQTADDEEKQTELPAVHSSPVLYRDALQSVFKFCGLADLSCVMCVRRSWSEVVRTMPSIEATVARNPLRCSKIARSDLASHVATIGGAAIDVKLTGHSLSTLKSLPGLTKLDCIVTMPRSQILRFPRTLQTLRLRLEGHEATVYAINDAIRAISRLPLLTDLDLNIPEYSYKLSFSDLILSRKLRSLSIFIDIDLDDDSDNFFDDDHIDLFRALEWLQKISIFPMTKHTFTRLLRAPHQLKWQSVDCPGGGVGAAEATLLASLPLTKLNVYSCRDVSFVAPLSPWLRDLKLRITSRAVSADALATGVSQCAQLVTLELTSSPMTSAHLSRMLSCLAALTELSLNQCRELESLRCFSECKSVQASLRKLSISRCRHSALRVSDAQHVLSLRSLTSLHLVQSFDAPLDEGMLQLLTPPSGALLSLRQLEHSFNAEDPADEEEDEEVEEEEEDD